MQTTQEFGSNLTEDVIRTEEFIDKIVTEDKLLSSDTKNGDVGDVSGSYGTNPKDLKKSPSHDLDDRDRFELENKFIKFVCEDDSLGFVSLFKSSRNVNVSKTMDIDGKPKREDSCSQVIDYLIPCKLLHLACKLDSVACASAILEGEIGCSLPVNSLDEYGKTALHQAAETHSVQCIDLLLRKQARTDIKSKGGQIPLDVALHCRRMQVHWSLHSGIAELLQLIENKDITAVRVLAANTNDVPQLAYMKAIDGHIVPFAVLLIVSTGSVLSALVQSYEEPYIQATIFDNVVRKAISLRQIECRSNNNNNDPDHGSTGSIADSENRQRTMLLLVMELLLLFTPPVSKPRETKRSSANASFSPLVWACQAGDEAVVKLLLNGNFDPNETDGDGNTPLHWCLRASSANQDTSLLCLLLRHDASVTVGNRLGLIPVHMAASHGHVQALQILLFRDPEAVDIVSETKETPLFYAVKNNHVDCCQLLLQYGANRQALNLRKQRPIDLAKTQEIREMLNSQSSLKFGKLKEYLPKGASLEKADWLENDKCPYIPPKHLFSKNENANQIQERDEESVNMPIYTKTEICRYYESPGGCVRGDKCYYAHGEGELRRVKMLPADVKQGSALQTSGRSNKRIPDDLNRKVFIGGLSPSVESEDLRDFFESKFGPVVDAIVIGSQAGEHIQSRGFGFVTFKYEESVVSAVEAHYVTILGKKVEIKGAVPRSMLPTLELMKVNTHEGITSTKQEDVQEKDSEGHRRNQITPWERVLGVQEENLEAQSSASLVPLPESSPPWVQKFKTWLPEFLGEVSKRLNEGEWYPLSSLKGDFRATCGMELDHVSLGYFKLSDFIRSMPGLCRMKIVPVGRGPATHMVLLELLPKAVVHHSISTSHHPHQRQIIGSSSFVDKGRSYAAAAGLGSSTICPDKKPPTATASTHAGADHVPSTDFCENSTSNLAHACKKSNSSDHQPISTNEFPVGTDEDIRYLSSIFSVFNVNADGKVCTNINPNLSVNPLALDQPPISFPQATEIMEARQKSPLRYSMGDSSKIHITAASSPTQYGQSMSNSTPRATVPSQEDFFLNFLDSEGSSFFTPWGQQKPSYSMEPPLWKPTLNRQLWENSPQSVLSPYSPQDSPFQNLPTTNSSFEIAESSKISQAKIPNCGLCKERKAIWVAVPCAHRALCTPCRDTLKFSHKTLNCFICGQPMGKLLALH